MPKIKKNLEGIEFGKLTVKNREVAIKGRSAWLCICICGNKKIIIEKSLKSGQSKSCGNCNPLNIGDKKGRLTIISSSYRINGSTYINAICECGNKKKYHQGNIKNGTTKSCGCLRTKRPVNWINLTGNQYSFLKVLNQEPSRITAGGQKKSRYACKCSCGTVVVVDSEKLKIGHTKSCGCLIYNPESSFRKLFGDYKSAAKKRDVNFSLTYESFTKCIQKNCNYCSVSPYQKAKGWKTTTKTLLYNGLDRINNDEGYDFFNIVPCCGICNRMKSDTPLELFIEHIFKILHAKVIPPTKSRNTSFNSNSKPFKAYLKRLKANSKERKIKFNLSDDEVYLLARSHCFYCGKSPNQRRTTKNVMISISGLDRVDSAKGYEKHNCVACCKICNRIKSDMSLSKFYAHLENVRTKWLQAN